ncbi:hypothetical protein [Agromyces sp. NPDC058064]|uniref:hypothetical protein n=1 Tax=Agromyces sp. NPDC058064 TaxID=3346322 RepID=UPI0036DE1669
MRRERKEAKQAIDAARAAEAEVRRMAKRSPKGSRARSRLESAVRFAEAEMTLARAGRRDSPVLAARRAERAAARLDRAASRFGPRAGAASRRDRKRVVGGDAAARSKARAELLKRRRKQAEQARKMAKKVAALTIGQAIVVPNDRNAADDAAAGGAGRGTGVGRRSGGPGPTTG